MILCATAFTLPTAARATAGGHGNEPAAQRSVEPEKTSTPAAPAPTTSEAAAVTNKIVGALFGTMQADGIPFFGNLGPHATGESTRPVDTSMQPVRL